MPDRGGAYYGGLLDRRELHERLLGIMSRGIQTNQSPLDARAFSKPMSPGKVAAIALNAAGLMEIRIIRRIWEGIALMKDAIQ
jgi:hypothetical protein